MQTVRIESVQDFIKRMGVPFVLDQHIKKRTDNPAGVPIYFENGAVSAHGSNYDPPTDDPPTLTRNLILYCRNKLEVEEKEFASFRQWVADQADFHRRNPVNCPPPSTEAVQQLEDGRQRILALRQRLESLRYRLVELTDPERIRHLRGKAENEARSRQQAAQVAHAIKGINI